MNVLYIDKPQILIEIANGVLKIDDRKTPLYLIDAPVISSAVQLSSKTILKLTDEGIFIIFTRFDRYAIIHGANAKNSELKAAQYKALNDALNIAKYLVEEKIIRHANSLKNKGIELPAECSLKQISSARTLDELRGVEGIFAHRYFSEFFTLIDNRLHGGARVKRPPPDPANALLSYLYSLFHGLLSVKLLANGFELGIAYLHTPFRSHNALASDLIELFRHAINEMVIELFMINEICISDFAKKDGIYLRSEARRKLYWRVKDLWLLQESQVAKEIANLRKLICRSDNEPFS
ncbi:MAG: CRISPR-associated endonuclease Cas1 [Helicobacteraceae bacterium]|jgi:CRISPR-associated protein Cas1|nr:CRISPR-associated endonuclease Cas1 [Helicobacteraceae bacterium]